jgi:hypothetical protein
VDAGAGEQGGHRGVDGRRRDLEVVGQAPMALYQEGPGGGEVAGGQGGGDGVDPGALGDDVAGPAPEHGIAQADDVLAAGEAQWPDDGRRRFALGDPGCVAGVAQRAPLSRVCDQHVGTVGHPDVAGGERREVDEERVTGTCPGTGERVEQADG